MRKFDKPFSFLLTIIYVIFIVLYSGTVQANCGSQCKCNTNTECCCQAESVNESDAKLPEKKSCCSAKKDDSKSTKSKQQNGKSEHKCKCKVSQGREASHEGKRAHTLPHSFGNGIDFTVIQINNDYLGQIFSTNISTQQKDDPPILQGQITHLFLLRAPPVMG